MARFLPFVFLLVLVLMTTEMGQVAEGRRCFSQSHEFVGTCIRRVNCHAICQAEGFYGGRCDSFFRRCTCYKDC